MFPQTTNIDVADFMEKLAYLGCSVPKFTASSLAWWVKFLDVPASFSLTASVIMAEIKSSAKTMMLKVLFRRNLFNSATCVKLSLFVSVPPILFILRWQLGSPCLPIRVTSRRFPAVESWILWFYGRCGSRNLPESQASRCFKHALGRTPLWCSG